MTGRTSFFSRLRFGAQSRSGAPAGGDTARNFKRETRDMTTKLKLLATAGSVGVAALSAVPAYAAGTASGTDITNTATVSYNVGGVAQTAQSGSDTIKVDRKVNLTVAQTGTTTTTVNPGSVNQVATFTVTNTSNAPLDFALAVTQQAGGAAANGGTDNRDANNVRIFVDANGNGVYDAGTDTATFIDELAADGIRTVFVVADFPLTATNGQVAAVDLRATAREAGLAGTQGAAITESAGANGANTVETVFADTAGTATGDVARDASHSAKDDYTVAAAVLSVVKTSRVISDPFNNTTNPKMIPGAVVEYCIAVSNGAGGATATNVSISDPVPLNTTFVASSIFVNQTVAGGVCTGATAGGSFGANTVSGTITDVAAGETRGLRFQVTIN